MTLQERISSQILPLESEDNRFFSEEPRYAKVISCITNFRYGDFVNPLIVVVTKGHTYLNKLAAFSDRFV